MYQKLSVACSCAAFPERRVCTSPHWGAPSGLQSSSCICKAPGRLNRAERGAVRPQLQPTPQRQAQNRKDELLIYRKHVNVNDFYIWLKDDGIYVNTATNLSCFSACILQKFQLLLHYFIAPSAAILCFYFFYAQNIHSIVSNLLWHLQNSTLIQFYSLYSIYTLTEGL